MRQLIARILVAGITVLVVLVCAVFSLLQGPR
jgi:hypothetical protein